MADKKADNNKSIKIANVSSIVMFFVICGSYIYETLMARVPINFVYIIPVMLFSLLILSIVIRSTINRYKLAFNVPFVLMLFCTALVLWGSWNNSNYMLFSLAFFAISCIYSSFGRTIAFMVIQNLAIGLLIFTNSQINANQPFYVMLVSWGVFIFASIIMLILTRSATILLRKALMNQQSFMDLLDTTENFVTMINDQNEVLYASKTLSQLGNTDEQSLVQGRPILDLFPGRNLKMFASKLLKEKDDYLEDWEFTLDGQKRYFKAASHAMRGGSGGALISMYDMTHLAERDEIAAMKDSMKIGLFFMDSNYIIQDHYSRYLEEMLSDTKLFGKTLTDVITDSVSANELNSIKDYFKMILERTYDQDMLDDINPLNELHYNNKKTGERKVFQFAFATVERGRGDVFILVTVYDITIRIELQQKLKEEEARRQEEMEAIFELINVDPKVFSNFMEDMDYEFNNINEIQKNEVLSVHDALVKIYQSVHAIKSNAVILGLNVFGSKVHTLESYIKKLREMEGNIPFSEMLNLTMEIEKLSNEREKFIEIIDNLKVHTKSQNDESGEENQNVKVLVDSFVKTATRAAEDMGKQIKLNTNEIDPKAVEKCPRRIIKEILIQLIRNSAVHGIEFPEERKTKGKNETGLVKLSVKMADDKKHINIKLSDDGQGLDYKKIAERAIERNIIKNEDAGNREMLLKALFTPGFSTAETEGIHGGRGIGLNLVRDRLKEVSGTIKLRSEEDKGVVFLISIPVSQINLEPIRRKQ